jgi:threonine dehydrogenase-like Zn-dependent dehydrogenase
VPKAAVYQGANKEFEIREFPLTKPQKDMALLRLVASGVCGTDLHILNGKLGIEPPKVIGHEFVGEVVELGSESDTLNVGDNVIATIAVPCEECLLCKTGDDANCVNMGVTNGGNPYDEPHFWGGFGEYNYSPIKNLVKIPKSINPKTASVFACAGSTVIHAFSLAKRANVDLENLKTCVVQGLGPVGMFAVAYLASLKVENVIAITGRENKKREELAKSFGSTKIFSLEKNTFEEIDGYIKSVSGGLGADLAVEASGNKDAFLQGIDMLRNRGVYLVPGQYSNSGTIPLPPQVITFKALHIIGSSQYSAVDIEEYVKFLEENRDLHPVIDSMITEYLLSDINKAFENAKQGKNVKTILVGG